MAEKKKPVLSIGMIVKDEIRSIERCLKALDPLRKALSCELVIADTGSSDGTREVAAGFADVLFDFEWINDFSAARNAVIDRCSGTWCLMVDADEYLDENIKDVCAFLKDPKSKKIDALRIIQRNYITREMLESDYTDFQAMRLFRIDSGLRYQNTIHEAFVLTSKTVVGYLPALVLKHDGYAQRSPQELEAHAKRCMRNLKLLEEKLESGETENPLVYIQCIEATITPAERKHYCELAFEYFSRKKRKTLTAEEKALACRVLPSWFMWKEERAVSFLNSIEKQLKSYFLYESDVSGYAARYYDGKADFDKALQYSLQYAEAVDVYDRKAYEENSLALAAPCSVYQRERQIQKLILARAQFKTGNEKEAKESLESISLSELVPEDKQLQFFLQILEEMAEFDWAPTLAQRVFLAIADMEEGADKIAVQNMLSQRLTNELAKSQESPAWRLFEEAPGELGVSVWLRRAEESTDIEALLSQIENFDKVSPIALYRVVECRHPFIENFYRQGIEKLQKLAAVFSIQSKAADVFLRWVGADKSEPSLYRLRFLFDYSVLLLQKGGWNADEWNALCRLFVRLADTLTVHLYHPDFLDSKGEWGVLPQHQQFALLMLLAKKSLQDKDELKFMRLLHEGLRAAPNMKHFVNHLSDSAQHLSAFPPPELLSLATQVRALLEQFPSDHPSLEQLKSSEAYQQVAALLDSPYTV